MNLFFALSAQNETNFFQDLWNYFYSVYLSVDGNYENLGFEKTPLFSLRLTVLGIFLGTIIACVAMAYRKQILGGVARKVIEDGALSPESAKSAEELGFGKKFLYKNALRSSTSLRRFVKCVAEEEFYKEQNIRAEKYEQRRKNGELGEDGKKLPRFKEQTYMVDIENDRFYIPEELRIRTEIRFEKKGSGWLASVIGIIVLCIVFFVLLLVLPSVFGALNDFLGSLEK